MSSSVGYYTILDDDEEEEDEEEVNRSEIKIRWKKYLKPKINNLSISLSIVSIRT